MTICYFTASGNCLYVARRIGGTLLSIPQLMKREDIEIGDDAVGVVCPVYCGEMPMMVREFMGRAKIRTGYFFFVYTFGMSAGEACAHAELAAREAGLKLSYAAAIRMVDNYLPGFEMREQIETLPQKDVEGQLRIVCDEIARREERPVTVTPGKRVRMTLFRRMLARNILRHDAARSYIVTDECVRCGVCERVCPADNITVTEKKVTFSDRCEVCYACLHNCPHNAIHLRSEKSAARFRNGEILLKDIVEANR